MQLSAGPSSSRKLAPSLLSIVSFFLGTASEIGRPPWRCTACYCAGRKNPELVQGQWKGFRPGIHKVRRTVLKEKRRVWVLLSISLFRERNPKGLENISVLYRGVSFVPFVASESILSGVAWIGREPSLEVLRFALPVSFLLCRDSFSFFVQYCQYSFPFLR